MTTTETKMTPNELQLAEGPESYLTADLSSKSTQQAAPATPSELRRAEDELDRLTLRLPEWLTQRQRAQVIDSVIERFGASMEAVVHSRSQVTAEPVKWVPGECPDWCEIDSDTGEGTVHTALGGREEGRWVVEYGFEDHDPTNERRPFVFAEMMRSGEELTPAEALAMGKALIHAGEQLGATS
ncbi:hypothetical protein H5392_01370 [Tessaracoccus sp. MC1865]|uniref:hypothetical protein n=1 Tax=Tessaracoccus sp. MC1865 TaxID=2760310 RepID=UPI001600CF84|nr:hypothetical protein [Tessaracoccus sp. MC1865]MBB1482507.1 hypothetical protein [Tessaracoccus sp. MC1865]QTO38038.1 hypothetical protein J7D54_02720 [Tessaracoccus sp. MC1865]